MKPAADTTSELPGTIAGLWALCALTPLRTRAHYEDAAALCGRLAVRRLNAAQREYQRELLALVEAYEQTHHEEDKALAALRKLASVTREGWHTGLMSVFCPAQRTHAEDGHAGKLARSPQVALRVSWLRDSQPAQAQEGRE